MYSQDMHMHKLVSKYKHESKLAVRIDDNLRFSFVCIFICVRKPLGLQGQRVKKIDIRTEESLLTEEILSDIQDTYAS